MATGGDSVRTELTLDYTNICCICLEHFRDPYNLPCAHCFCGICLIGYLKKCLIKEGEDKNTFPCPLCRTKMLVSNYTKVELDDVRQLGQLSFLRMDIENESKKPDERYCETCKRGGDSVPATHFCSDCGERLCAECLTHHRRNKMTFQHKIENLRHATECTDNLIQMVNTTCESHNKKKYKYICIDHDILCCSKCVIADHRKCLEVQPFLEFIQGKRYTGMLREIHDRFANIHGLTRNLRRRDSVLIDQLSTFENTMKNLEKDMHTEVSKIFSKQRTIALEKVRQKREGLREALHKSELQNNRVSKFEDCFHFVKDEKDTMLNVVALRDIMCSLKTEQHHVDDIALMLENTRQKIEVDMELFDQPLHQRLERAFHELKSNEFNFIPHVRSKRPRLIHSMPGPRKVNDIILLESGKIILATNGVDLSVADSVTSKETMQIKLSSPTTSLTEYTNNTLAIAIPTGNKVAILNLRGQTPHVSYVETGKSFDCIASGILDQTPVIVSITAKTGDIYFQIVKSGVKNDWKPIGASYRNVTKMCVDGPAKFIYISQYKVNKISGIDFQGHTKFAFTHHQLHMPIGMFLGVSDKLFVCCYGTHQVCEVTPSTRNFADIICGLEGLKGPMAIAFNTTRTKCVVFDDEKGKELKIFDMTQ